MDKREARSLLRVFVKTKWIALLGLVVAPVLVSGCSTTSSTASNTASLKSERSFAYPLSERKCLERAMFFESNRSSREGLVAVGTVVMNRVNSSHYPNTICGVVGQKNQFAPGVLSRPMNSKALPDVQAAADAVLRGERHPKLKRAMFFHTAGLKFPYRNMYYQLVAGGNAFYEKRRRDGTLSAAVNDRPYNVAFAFKQEKAGNAPVFNTVTKAAPEKGTAVAAVAASDTKVALSNMIAAGHVPVPAFKNNGETAVALGYTVSEPVVNDPIGALLIKEAKIQ